MTTKKGFIKVYDTLKGEYVLVEVSKEVETFMRRSYWKEDMQKRRYDKRTVDMDYVVLKYDALMEQRDLLINKMIHDELVEELYKRIEKLNDRQKKIIDLVYKEECTLCEAAKRCNISASYTSRLMKDILIRLKEEMSE